MADGRVFPHTLIIVIPWDESVESYVEAGKEIDAKRPENCPACKYPRLIFWGGRFRFAMGKERDFRLYVRRVRCRGCEQTHTLLPAFLFRRRIHLAELIVAALKLRFLSDYGVRSTAKELNLSRSAVRRWLGKFAESTPSHYRRFCRLYHTHFPGAPPPASNDNIPAVLLRLAGRLFVLQTNETNASDFMFASWLCAATGGNLLA